MDREEQHMILVEIGRTLDRCRQCAHTNRTMEPPDMTYCKVCPNYQEMQALRMALPQREDLFKGYDGEWFGEEAEQLMGKGRELSLAECVYLVSLGVPRKRIAKAKGLNYSQSQHFYRELGQYVRFRR